MKKMITKSNLNPEAQTMKTKSELVKWLETEIQTLDNSPEIVTAYTQGIRAGYRRALVMLDQVEVA